MASTRASRSSVEESAAVVIQSWLRGHQARREIAGVWLTYLSAVRSCEGEDAEYVARLPLLKNAEAHIRVEELARIGASAANATRKGGQESVVKKRTNPYQIPLNIIATHASRN